MASGVKLKRLEVDGAALKAVLNGERACRALDAAAEAAVEFADAVGTATYAMHAAQAGSSRAHAIVYTPSRHAIYSNAKHDTLVKALANMRST